MTSCRRNQLLIGAYKKRKEKKSPANTLRYIDVVFMFEGHVGIM